jgi:hypothetical protein
VVAGEEEASCPGVAAAEPFNFLSDLPDLVLRTLIDLLQPGGVPPTSGTVPSVRCVVRDDDGHPPLTQDLCSCTQVYDDHDDTPEPFRTYALHRAFESDADYRHIYEQQSEEPSAEEWAAYQDELQSRPQPLSHVPCVLLFHPHVQLVSHRVCVCVCSYEVLTGMGTEVVPRVSPSLLALRLTCHSVKWSIETVAHHRLFPPFELFTRVDRWLTSQVRWPTLLFATSPQDAGDQHCIREIERVAVGCANARLLQLRSVIVCEHA